MSHPHKPGLDKNSLVKRHLKLEGEGDVPWSDLEEEIDKIIGIDEVHLVPEDHAITVVYDASCKSLSDVEKILDAHFIHFSEDWWTNVKKSWYGFTDQNIKDNAKHEPWSCHTKR